MRAIGLERVQIGQQIVDLLLIERVAEAGHHVAPVKDGLLNVLIGGGQSAGQIGLAKYAFESRSVQRSLLVGVVATGALLLIEQVAAQLLRIQLAQWL